MKKTFNSTIIILLIGFVSCKQPAKKQEPVTSPSEKEKTYTDDQFRRFTYFFQSDNPEVKMAFEGALWDDVQKQAKSVAIQDINVYRKENDYFLAVDVIPTMNSKSVLESLEKLTAFKELQAALQKSNVAFPKYDQALERIYKLDQKVTYIPTAGQLKTDIGNHKRFVWTLLLQEDPKMMAEYKKIHGIGQAWPQITANMKSIGVKDMEIYLYGEQAILIMDTQPDFDLKAIGPKWQALPKESEWQAYVAKYQRTKPGSSIQEKWLDMIKL